MSLRTTFILPSYAGGGAERAVLTLIRNLDSARVIPKLIVLDGRGPAGDLVPEGVPAVDLKRPRLRTAWPALLTTLRLHAPDAVVSTLGYVNVALLAMRPLLRGRPLLIVREANAPSVSFAAVRWPGLMRRAYRALYPRADAILYNAGSTADELIHLIGVAEDRLHHLKNPVDVDAIRSRAEPPVRTPGPGLRFVAAGRLTRQKGFDRLLDMMAELLPDCALTILGDGPERAVLEEQATRLGLAERVVFAGFEPAPWSHYAGADAFLLPSRWEGQSNAALEALACGTPVIGATEAGGIAELAEAAPAGAVTVVEWGPSFLDAMAAIVPQRPVRLGPSLLPSGYSPAEVADSFTGILESALSVSDASLR